MLNCLAVGIGGFCGSVLRYLMGMIPIKGNGSLPMNTLVINILGAFAIGIIVAIFAKNSALDSRILLMLKVGFCGGFSTLSSLSLETMYMMKSGSWITAFIYIVLTFALCILATFLGTYIIK